MIPGEVEIGFSGNWAPKAPAKADTPDWKQRTTANRRRGLKVSRQVKQKDLIYDQLHDWWATRTLTPVEEEYICSFRQKLSLCCHNTLFREFADGTKEFIGAHTCKHKLCPVCNAQRSKKTRKVWRKFFVNNPELLENYDFMHLTLTVPHSSQGWRGNNWYADELMKEFNYMRKKAFWKRQVYAGEFGVEVTRNDDGMHIHIHALLLVYKGKQNRNNLHRFILEAWNRQTKGSSQRTAFSEEEKAAIMKGNKSITPEFVNEMFPCGATFIGLESLYLQSKEQKKGYHFCDRLGGWKKYVSPKDGQDIFLAGVMECIKYHFEPMAMKKDGTYDFDLICEILPAIKGKPLYRKFGAFHASSKNAHPAAQELSFNYKDEDAITEIAAELEENGREVINHPDTGLPVEREDYQYFLVNMAKIFFDPENDYRPELSSNVRVRYLQARTVVDALVDMELLSIHQQSRNNQLIISKTKYYA